MRKILAISVSLGLLLALVAAAPATAGTRTAVTMTVTTFFDPDPDFFTATGLGSECAWGWVSEAGGRVQFTPAVGVFAGYKVFMCEGGEENGFVVRLNARFGPFDPVGTWAVVAAWGSLAGMKGAGQLSADPFPDGSGVTDNYVGTVTR